MRRFRSILRLVTAVANMQTGRKTSRSDADAWFPKLRRMHDQLPPIGHSAAARCMTIVSTQIVLRHDRLVDCGSREEMLSVPEALTCLTEVDPSDL